MDTERVVAPVELPAPVWAASLISSMHFEGELLHACNRIRRMFFV